MNNREAKRFYDSKQWKTKRLEILKRDCFECKDCKMRLKEASEQDEHLRPIDRRIRRAKEVHHIKELKEYPELKLDNDNLISLCVDCHNKRHGRNTHKFAKKKEYLTQEMW